MWERIKRVSKRLTIEKKTPKFGTHAYAAQIFQSPIRLHIFWWSAWPPQHPHTTSIPPTTITTHSAQRWQTAATDTRILWQSPRRRHCNPTATIQATNSLQLAATNDKLIKLVQCELHSKLPIIRSTYSIDHSTAALDMSATTAKAQSLA